MISVFIFTLNDFQPWKIEERERERARRSPTSEQEDCIGARRSHRSDCSNPPSSKPVTDHRDRLAIFEPRAKRETERERRGSREIVAPPARSSRHRSRTHSHQIANESTRTAPTNPPRRRTHSSNPPLRRKGFLSLRSRHWLNFFGWVLFGSWENVRNKKKMCFLYYFQQHNQTLKNIFQSIF